MAGNIKDRLKVDQEILGVVSGGVFGALFLVLGLGALFGGRYGYGGDAVASMGFIAILGLMVCGAGLLYALFHPRFGLPSLALGTLIGLGIFVHFAGLGVKDDWTAPPDRPSDIRAIGSWSTGDLVVRARPDKVVAYRATTGDTAWSWTPPAEDSVCAMSRETGHGIGLFAHGAHGRPCATAIALDLATGTPRWTANLDAPLRAGDTAAPGLLAVAGDRAVLQETGGWRAVSLTDGSAAWRSAVDPDCAPLRVAGGPDTAVTVAQCTKGGPVLRTLAPQDGQERTHTVLPLANGLNDAAVLSADPLTVWVDEQGDRGTHAVLAFDRAGKVRSTIPVSGDEYDLDVTLGGAHAVHQFEARPAYGAVVVGDLLVVPGEKPDDVTFGGAKHNSRHATGRLVAYSLADGGKRWTAGLDDQVTGLAVDGTRVWAMTRNSLTGVDTATGHEDESLAVLGTESDDPSDLAPDGPGRFTVVARDGTTDAEPPVQAVAVPR